MKSSNEASAGRSAAVDGIESDGQGGYIVSDYMAGKLMRVGADGKATVVKQLKQGTADIAYVPSQKLVIVTFPRN